MCIFDRKYVLQCVDFDDEFEKYPGGNTSESPTGEGDSPRPLTRGALGAFGPSLVQLPLTSNPGYAFDERSAGSILINSFANTS